MTDQELFNKVSAHLLRQGERAVAGGKCAYRAPDGLSCAVGCLIAPEAYSKLLEGQGVVSLDVRAALGASGIEPTYPTMVLLSELQDLHDRIQPRLWPAELNLIAKKRHYETH
jgi:hypothetical protein